MVDSPVIVLDFETTGLSPNHGDRAIEIGAVLIENYEIVDSFFYRILYWYQQQHGRGSSAL